MLSTHQKPTVRMLEHEGFYQGAHGTNYEHVLAEIKALFNRRRAEAEKAAVETTKPIEARIEYLTKITPTVERHWRDVEERFEGREPDIVRPIVYLVAGVAAMLAEAFTLAPSLDLLNVPDPIEQRVVAFVIGVVSALLFHFAWETLQENRFSRPKIVVSRAAGLGALIALVFLGALRGHQNAFAATLAENPLAQFLHDYPTLATAFFVFLTVGFPLAAAFGLTFSLKDIHEWQVFRNAKVQAESTPNQLIQNQKQLEMEKEKLVQDLKALEEEQNQWSHTYVTHHERGRTIGAKQSTKWLVWAKSLSFAGLVLALTGWLCFMSPFLFVLPVASFIAAYVYFRRARIHPTPGEYYALQDVRFSSVDREPQLSLFEADHRALPEPDGVFGEER
jgi:hypothetical protein